MPEAGSRWWLRWSLLFPASVLAGAVAMQGMALMRETPAPREAHLQWIVPAELPGWTSREVPLGANEFIVGEVEKILNYDEVINREFRRGSATFGVYVAYWSPGKMPTRLVASHTPDRCWTENGWRCLDMRFKQVEKIDGAALQPAEWRLFEPPAGGQPMYVLYWHLVEGRVYDYGERFNAVPHPVLWWKDALQQAMHGSREQHFVRVTSNRPFSELRGDPAFEALLRGLSDLGLRQTGGGNHGS
jgi:hypothetical protein